MGMDRSPTSGGLDPLPDLLATADLRPRGFLANASNHTLLVQVGPAERGVHAVYKPRKGERPLWDFPGGTLCQREAAAWLVSEALGWQVVPPTVLRDGPMGVGSVQLFVPHDPEQHYFVLIDDPTTHDALARMALFDLLVNNADRKGSHVLRTDDGRILGCDHGLTFHADPKLRTVIWDLGGRPIDPALRADLRRLAAALADDTGALRARITPLLSPAEVAALVQRAGILADLRALPALEHDRRPYPWPPL
jgi:uncharacterized repeat protein (TIGR03843 family)